MPRQKPYVRFRLQRPVEFERIVLGRSFMVVKRAMGSKIGIMKQKDQNQLCLQATHDGW